MSSNTSESIYRYLSLGRLYPPSVGCLIVYYMFSHNGLPLSPLNVYVYMYKYFFLYIYITCMYKEYSATTFTHLKVHVHCRIAFLHSPSSNLGMSVHINLVSAAKDLVPRTPGLSYLLRYHPGNSGIPGLEDEGCKNVRCHWNMCDTVDGRNPANPVDIRVLHIPDGAGFLPSTAVC